MLNERDMSDELDPKKEGEGNNSENTEQASSNDEPTKPVEAETKATHEPVPDVPETLATDAKEVVEEEPSAAKAQQEEDTAKAEAEVLDNLFCFSDSL